MKRTWTAWGLSTVLGASIGWAAPALADRDDRFEHHDNDRHGEYQQRNEMERRGFEHRGRAYRGEERQNVRGYEAREYRGRHFNRPRVDIDVYARPYAHMHRFHRYGTYGLPPALSANPDLAFLSEGLLVGSYFDDGRTIYVYVIDEDGAHRELRVDQSGNIISDRVVP